MRLFKLFLKNREKKSMDNDISGNEKQDLRTVQGTVVYTDFFPASGINVSAYRKGLRTEHILGEAVTAQNGSYNIRYETDNSSGTPDHPLHLVVKAYDDEGILLAESPVCFNPPVNAWLNLILTKERVRVMSEYERLGRAISPLLEGLTIEELEENNDYSDLSFIEAATGFSKNVTARFALAHKLKSYGMEPEFWFALLGGTLFRYYPNKSLSEQLPEIREKLSLLDYDFLKENLIRAFYQDEIPAYMQDKVEQWIERFKKLQG